MRASKVAISPARVKTTGRSHWYAAAGDAGGGACVKEPVRLEDELLMSRRGWRERRRGGGKESVSRLRLGSWLMGIGHGGDVMGPAAKRGVPC